MAISIVQTIKLAIVSFTGLSKDALHIYVGLALFFFAAAMLRKPLRSIVPWLAAGGATAAGELLDIRDDSSYLGYWRWGASAHHMINTLFWPTVLLFLARAGMVFGTTNTHNPRFGS